MLLFKAFASVVLKMFLGFEFRYRLGFMHQYQLRSSWSNLLVIIMCPTGPNFLIVKSSRKTENTVLKIRFLMRNKNEWLVVFFLTIIVYLDSFKKIHCKIFDFYYKVYLSKFLFFIKGDNLTMRKKSCWKNKFDHDKEAAKMITFPEYKVSK